MTGSAHVVHAAARLRAALERAAQRLPDFQRQVASGARIARPSGDPAATAAAIGERAGLSAVEPHARTADSAVSRLTVIDTALSDLNTSFQGTYVFAGAAPTTPPFAVDAGGTVGPYQGSALEVRVDVGERRDVTVGFDGSQVSRDAAAADVFATLDAAVAAARAGDHGALQQARADLEAAFERATATRMRVGASLASIEGQQARLSDRRLAALARVAGLEDANLAEAISSSPAPGRRSPSRLQSPRRAT